MKNCFVATLGTSPKFELALKNLKASLSHASPLEFTVEKIPSLNSTVEKFSADAIPHVILIDPNSLEGHENKRLMDSFFAGVRQLDPSVCILVLWSGNPSSHDLMSWLDRGATGLYNPEVKNPESDAALFEALEQRVSVQLPRDPRTNTKHRVKIQVASLEQAMAAETLNLGFGGMFLRISPRDIRPGDEVEFHLEFSDTVAAQTEHEEIANPLLKKMDDSTKRNQAELDLMEGVGRVVWIRPTAKDDLPEGIGLQFSKLAPQVKESIRKFVVNHRLRAFIPKA